MRQPCWIGLCLVAITWGCGDDDPLADERPADVPDTQVANPVDAADAGDEGPLLFDTGPPSDLLDAADEGESPDGGPDISDEGPPPEDIPELPDVPPVDDDGPCAPACAGKGCGPDGCGGSCGECGVGATCLDQQCVDDCVAWPTCECVLDACGLAGPFGPTSEACAMLEELATFAPTCLPTVLDAFAGAETCGSDCTSAPIPGLAEMCGDPVCDEFVWNLSQAVGLPTDACTLCFCEPSCGGKTCGDNGCGGSCGVCGTGSKCVDGACQVSACLSMAAKCESASFPTDVICDILPPECLALVEDAWAVTGTCGPCPQAPLPGFEQVCALPACAPVLELLTEVIALDLCESCFCEPSCTGLSCGDDGCGGSCGACADGLYCAPGGCVEDGVDTCVDMAACLAECGAADEDCSANCVSGAMFAELPKLTDYSLCIAGCLTLEPALAPECLVAECWEPYYACLASSKGDADCFSTFYCVQGCPLDDPSCSGTCFDAAQGPGVSKLALNTHACVTKECGVDYDDACAEIAQSGPCASWWGACDGEGACTNEPDLALVQSDAFGEAVSECGASCPGYDGECTAECLQGTTTVSSACGLCYGAVFECIVTQCADICGAGPEACEACGIEAGCTPDFVACSGLGPSGEPVDP